MMGRPINKIWFLLSISAVIAVFISFEYSKAIDLIIPEKKEREPAALEDKSMLQSDGQNFRILSTGSLVPTLNASDPVLYYYGNPGDCNRPTNFNQDRIINFIDYAIFANSWQTTYGDLNYNERCDLIIDDFIDYKDLACFSEDWLWRRAWGFETGTEYWVPRAGYDLGCTKVSQSSEYHTEGSYSLEMLMDLQIQNSNKRSGEAFVLYPCGDLSGKKIVVDIYCPPGSGGTPSAYNGLQVFVKDSEYRCEYGKWINISLENTWYMIGLTVDGIPDGGGGFVQSGFDPTDIIQIGVKMSLNSYATQDYLGSIYVDNVWMHIPEPLPPGPVPASDYAFDFTNMTPEIQASKSFADYSEHRPFWDVDTDWNANAWDSNDINIVSLFGNRVLSIDADLKGEDCNDNDRKGYVGIEAFPNIDIANKDNKVIRFGVKFESLHSGQYVGTAQVYAYNRRADPPTYYWFVGPKIVVGGTEWQEVSFDLSDYPEEDLIQLLKVGIQFWGDVSYTGKIYIDDITIGGVELDNFINRNEGFVTTNGTVFEVNEVPFRFAGNNCYYPFYKTHFMTNDLMYTMQVNGLKVLRTWGFCDGLGEFLADNDGYTPNGNEGCTFQPKLGKYDELTFRQLDYVIKCAGEHGIRLIIPLVNYWSDKDKYPRENAFGGVAQYVEWAQKAEYDTNGCITNKDLFYTDPNCKQAYKNYVAQVINRVNTLTRAAYKDDPTILAWELANEPEAESDITGDTVYNWAVEMSAFVKNLDAKHMVALGDCGFMKGETDPSGEGGDYPYNGYKGVDWIRNLGISDIDFGTVHVYPDHWFQYQPDVNQAVWAYAWIKKHIIDGHNAGKPIIFEEFGRMRSKGDRDALYTEWTDLFYGYEGYEAAGDCVWMIAGKVNNTDEDNYPLDPEVYYPDYDGFTFWDHNQTASTMDIIENHAAAMNSD